MHQKLMNINRSDIRIVGCIWLIISILMPLSILASGSEETIMTVILAIGSLAAGFLGFVSGLGIFFSKKWAALILRILSWIYALFFFGYSIFIITNSASMMANGNKAGILGILFATATSLFGALFLLMAKHLKKIHACLSKQIIA